MGRIMTDRQLLELLKDSKWNGVELVEARTAVPMTVLEYVDGFADTHDRGLVERN